MSTPVLVSILILVCLNISTISGELVSGSTTNPPPISENHLNQSKINILFLSIVNNLPPGSVELTMICSFDKGETPHHLEPGKPYTLITNFELKVCDLRMFPHHIAFHFYDRDKEGGLAHQKIFWSVRQDGLYHSWDNSNFDKRESWDN
jgi:hypothetical protein